MTEIMPGVQLLTLEEYMEQVIPLFADKTDQIFTYVNRITGEQLHFNSSRIRKHLVEHPEDRKEIMMPLTAQDAKYCLTNMGVERDRIRWLIQDAKIMFEPILGAWYNPKIPGQREGLLTIDGNHRMVALFATGVVQVKCWWCEEKVWRKFLVPLPHEPQDRLVEMLKKPGGKRNEG